MKKELKRIFYVTPTNYIELLKGYDKILAQKRKEIGTQVTKLDTGLLKLEAAAVSVNEMTAEANIKREEVNSAVENNSKLLAEINAKKTEAMKKKEFIDSESEKVTIEAKEC